MAICWRMVESVVILKKLADRNPKMIRAAIRTIIGTAEGVWCSQCCNRLSTDLSSWNSATFSEAPFSPSSKPDAGFVSDAIDFPPERRLHWYAGLL